MPAAETAKKVLAEALRTGADLAEIYVEDVTGLQISMDDSRIEQAIRGADRGAGVRVFFGNLVTYAYTDVLTEESLLEAARAAAAAGNSSSEAQIIDLTERHSPLQFVVERPFDEMRIAEKAAILSQMDEAGRAYQKRAQYPLL
jgi:TldD protein